MQEKFNIASYYRNHYDALCHYATLLLSNEEEARDIVSDSFLKLMEMEGRLDFARNIPALLQHIIRNRCYDLLRRRNSHETCSIDTLLLEPQESVATLPGRELEERELFAVVHKALDRLSSCERRAFLDIRLQNHSYRRTAVGMGISERSVEYNLGKATLKLREQYRQAYAV